MSRKMLLAAVAMLCVASSTVAQTDDGAAEVVHLRDGLVSFGHQPTCAGCRAFLAGYGTAEAMHSPSCSCACDAANAPEMGGGPAAPYAADSGEYQDLAASEFGAGLGYESAAPGMIGDFYGGGYQVRADEFRTFQQEHFNLSVAGGDRRYKIAENNSPFPIDRVFFNFNHFHNALRTANGNDAHLDRGVAGIEKTFLDQWWSFECRLPFMSGLNGDQVINSATANNVSNEVGNVGLALKTLLFQDATMAASIGLGAVLPSGSDSRVFDNPGATTPAIVVENEAYYLQPFAGLWWAPTDRFFSQYVIQADFDTRGNSVSVRSGGVLTPQGVIQDQTLLFLDASFGYWLIRDPYSDRVITGFAPMIEFHHSTTMQDTDIVDFSNAVGGGARARNDVSNPNNRQDVLNLTGALRLEIAGRSYLTFAGVTPLRRGEKLFDTEFSIQYTRFY
jgi:hypothetical protein